MPPSSEITADDIINAMMLGDEYKANADLSQLDILQSVIPPRLPPFKAYISNPGVLDIITCTSMAGRRSDTIHIYTSARYITVSVVACPDYMDEHSRVVHRGNCTNFLYDLGLPVYGAWIYANKYKTTKICLSRYLLTAELQVSIAEYMADSVDVI